VNVAGPLAASVDLDQLRHPGHDVAGVEDGEAKVGELQATDRLVPIGVHRRDGRVEPRVP